MQSEKDALIERYAGDAFKNRNNPDLTIGVWRQHFVEFSDKIAALSAAEPVATYRCDEKAFVERWWIEPGAGFDKLPDGTTFYAAPPAPSAAVKALEWREEGPYLNARIGDREYMLNITADMVTWAGSTRPYVFGHSLTWSSVPNCSFVSLEEAKAACQADFQSRYDALSAQVQDVATHRHKKRGSEYALIGVGRMQAETWQVSVDGFDQSIDMQEIAIYRSIDDGSLWARPLEEFNDGRFEPLPAAPAKQEG